jgi:hypothetical protein
MRGHYFQTLNTINARLEFMTRAPKTAASTTTSSPSNPPFSDGGIDEREQAQELHGFDR